jgi:pimeloyl-ACP methyl ester carboxylesterase
MGPRRQFAVALSGVLASVLVLSGCGLLLRNGESAVVPPQQPAGASASSSAPSAAPSASARPSGAPGLEDFYGQPVTWVNCGEADCAKLRVPLDYADPSGPTMELAMTRVKATGERIGSLFVDPGGPGGSAVDYARAARQVVSPAVLEHYDVVGVDPRGVGLSDPVKCFEDRQLDELSAVDGTPDDAAEQQQVLDEMALVGAGCKQRSAATFGHVGTADAARDLDIARSAVHDEVLNYLGKSYGTELGATYAELFPDRVGRMVLDGVLPVSLDMTEVTKGQAESFEYQVRDFVRDCLTHDDCPLTGSVDEGITQLQDWFTSLDANPIRVGDRDLNEALAAYAVVMNLYAPSWQYDSLRSALAVAMTKRDGTQLLDLLDGALNRAPDGRYLDNSTDAFYAVTCLDHPYTGTVDDVKALAEELRTTAPTFGESMAWSMLACKDWPASAAPLPTPVASGSNPILVVSTEHDPATPYQWGQLVAKQLQNARLLTWTGTNHTAYGEGSTCIDEAVDAYLLRGDLPQAGLVCS